MRRALLVVAAAAASGLVVAVGCSLGLDPSLIPGEGDASAPKDAAAEAALPDQAAPSGLEGGACASDKDCVSSSACVSAARCDRTYSVCVYDVCADAGACATSTCTEAGACAAATPHGFHAGSFTVPAGLACSPSAPSGCLAAAYPFVFVATTSSVSVYVVKDPASGAPAQVPLSGVPFAPTRIVSMGRRVYFVGAPSGSFLPLAWLDVPGDPLRTELHASSTVLTTPPGSVGLVLASPPASLFLVDPDPDAGSPSSLVTAPLAGDAGVTPSPALGAPARASVVAASGGRLVTYRYDGAPGVNAAYVSLETGAGSAAATNGGELEVTKTGAILGATSQVSFAEGDLGSVLWAAPGATFDEAGAPSIASLEVTWLFDDASATTLDPSAPVTVESYAGGLPSGTAVAGPIAWLAPGTALVVARAPESPATASPGAASVQVLGRDASAAALVPGERFVLDAGVGSLAAVGSGGFGFVLQASPANTSATVHVFAPGCP